jgi:CheY-like chemotaxis protein
MRPSTVPAVLLVDSSAETLEMYAVGIGAAGYRALTVPDADAAVSRLERERPAAVVTDLDFPRGRNGWELIRELQHDRGTRSIPVVVLTARAEPWLAASAQRAGCAAVLTKPCRPWELADVLRRLVPPRPFGRPPAPASRDGVERRLRPRNGGAGELPRPNLETMVVGTYREMPGLSLDLAQAARLFGLRVRTCEVLLDDLVRCGRLRRSMNGRYLDVA